MAFCVECGAHGETYRGLCGRCLVERTTFVRVPENLDLVECTHCHAILHRGTWERGDRRSVVERALRDSTTVAPELQDYRLVYHEISEDERNTRLDMEASGRVGSVPVVEALRTRVRFKGGVCDVCSRQRGSYFAGILQVRATDRDLRPREVDHVRKLVAHRTARGAAHGEFISREERTDGGLDFYLSTNNLAKLLARAVQGDLGGEVATSPKLHTRREGKDLYRVTYRVRLPAYAVGDVVEAGGELYQVVHVGSTVTTMALEDWARRTFKAAELSRARVVPSEEAQAVLVSQGQGEVQLLDPGTYETRHHRKPPGFRAPGETVTVLRVEDGTYIAPLQGEAHRVAVGERQDFKPK